MMKKRQTPKFRRARKSHPLLTLTLLVLLLLAAGTGWLLSSFNIDSARDKLSDLIQQKTGRTINFTGALAWHLSLADGISLAVEDIYIKNPSWASREDMARIGKAYLLLDLRSLLKRKISITAFTLTDTDLQLETGPNGKNNWTFTPDSSAQPSAKTSDKPLLASPSAAPMALNLNKITIADSRIGIKDKKGKLTIYTAPLLSLTNAADASNVHFRGSAAGIPVELDIQGKALEEIMGPSWPFNLIALYGPGKIELRGALHDSAQKVTLDQFKLKSGDTDLEGSLTVQLNQTRPSVKGRLQSQTLDLDDLAFATDAAARSATPTATASAAQSTAPSGSLFSHEPLALDAFRSADADIDLSINTLIFGLTSFEKIKTNFKLTNGKLALTPLKGLVAGSPTTVNLVIDAATNDAQIATSLKAKDMDLSQFFKLGGLESAISGKTNIDMTLTSHGSSSHDLAAHANGALKLLMDTGTVSSSQLSSIGANLVQLFAPGLSSLSKTGVNCMAAQYLIKDGLMDTKGLLIDTPVTTIAGKGYINLPDERIGMSLFTRPKGLGLESVIPPMTISGNLSQPQISLNTSGTVEKLTGLLLQNGNATTEGVPDLVTETKGNVCEATLNAAISKKPPSKSVKPLVPNSMNTLPDKVKDIGGAILQNI
ncbi:MAG: AsmA family protein, partial [Bdellovibrionales bacterium]